MSRINSKQKGKRGELDLVHELNDRGFSTERTAQFNGKSVDSEADLRGINGVHIECKVRERHNVYDYMCQVDRDKKDNELGCVFMKSSRKKWLVVMDLDDWIKLYSNSNYNISK